MDIRGIFGRVLRYEIIKTSKIKKMLPAIATIAIIMCVGTAVALWMGGFILTGQITATTGDAPTAVECSKDFTITATQNYTNDCEYDNTDGDITMSFTCDDSEIISTDSKCNYESGKDVKFYVGIDGSGYKLCNGAVTQDMTAGTHNISVIVEPHTNRCPLSGNYSVTGTIV